MIVAVAHKEFRQMGLEGVQELIKTDGVLIDVKGIFSVGELEKTGLTWWRL